VRNRVAKQHSRLSAHPPLATAARRATLRARCRADLASMRRISGVRAAATAIALCMALR
jgi:hypothetical protein